MQIVISGQFKGEKKRIREKGDTWFFDGQVCSLPLAKFFDAVPRLAGAAPAVYTMLHPQPADSLPQHVAPEVPVCLCPHTHTHNATATSTRKLTNWTVLAFGNSVFN